MSAKRIVVWVQELADRKNLALQWHDPETGERRTRSSGTADPVQAERERGDWEFQLNHGLGKEPNKITWETFRTLFEKEYAAGLRDKSSLKLYTVLDVFEQIIRPGKLADIDARVLSRFVQGMRTRKTRKGTVGLAPMTQRNYLVALKTALGWAVAQGLLLALPVFPKIEVPKKKPQPIPEDWFARLLEKAPDDVWRAYLLCGWWAGLRLSEARELRWDRSEEWPWLDLETNRIVLPAVFAKSKEDQSVPLHDTLREALAKLPRVGAEVFLFVSRKGHRRLSASGLSNRVRLMARQAGVKLSMHRLRKGFGCRVAQQLGKGNAPVLHELMRHSSMQITMDYYASVDDVLQDAMKELK